MLLMIGSVCIAKTFFFMRSVSMFSHIVKRLLVVCEKIQRFVTFFAMLIVLFSAIFNVIGRNEQPEHETIGYFFGGIIYAMRLSIGDFNFDLVKVKPDELAMFRLQNALFWFIWTLLVSFAMLVFVNFIIAEVSEAYNEFDDLAAQCSAQERAALIFESEEIMPSYFKTQTLFPKYIIIRCKEGDEECQDE